MQKSKYSKRVHVLFLATLLWWMSIVTEIFTWTGRDWWVTEPRIFCSKAVSYAQLTVGTGCRSAPEVERLSSAPESNQSRTTVRATSGGESDLLFRLSKAVDLGDSGVDNDSPLHPFHTNLCRSPWMFFFLVRTGFGWCLRDFQLCIWTSVFRTIIDLGVMWMMTCQECLVFLW